MEESLFKIGFARGIAGNADRDTEEKEEGQGLRRGTLSHCREDRSSCANEGLD